MVEQDVQRVEERTADLVAVFRRAAHPAQKAVRALGSILDGIEQNLLPPLHAGWSTRKKTNHFSAYDQVAAEFGKPAKFDVVRRKASGGRLLPRLQPERHTGTPYRI